MTYPACFADWQETLSTDRGCGNCNLRTECRTGEQAQKQIAVQAPQEHVAKKTGKPYVDSLIDRLLLPPPAMMATDVQKLHKECAEMLHLMASPPYVATPQQRQPLTDEQINKLREKHGVTSDGRGIKEFTKVRDFVRDIEAHGITGE